MNGVKHPCLVARINCGDEVEALAILEQLRQDNLLYDADESEDLLWKAIHWEGKVFEIRWHSLFDPPMGNVGLVVYQPLLMPLKLNEVRPVVEIFDDLVWLLQDITGYAFDYVGLDYYNI